MVAAAALFRAAMAVAGAVTFAAAGVLAAGVWMGGLQVQTPSLAGVDKSATAVVALASFPTHQGGRAADGAAGQLAGALWGDAQTAWGSLPPEIQMRLIVSGLGAGLVGLVVGAMMPRKAAALLTAMLGAGVFLASLWWVAQKAALPGRELLEHGPLGWLMIWGVVAGCGLVFQLCGQAKPSPGRRAAAG
jgi:hypothetical protein